MEKLKTCFLKKNLVSRLFICFEEKDTVQRELGKQTSSAEKDASGFHDQIEENAKT